LGTIDVRQPLEDIPQADHRLVGVFANVARDLRRLRDDVALALRPLHRIGRAAFAVYDRHERQLVALLFDRNRFRHADVVLTSRRARLVANETLHGELQAQFVVGEADPRSGLGIGDERDLIEWNQAIDEALCGGHDRAQRTGPDVDLIDSDDDLPAVGRRQVARIERLALVGDLPLRRLDVYLDQLGRDDPANFTVDQ